MHMYGNVVLWFSVKFCIFQWPNERNDSVHGCDQYWLIWHIDSFKEMKWTKCLFSWFAELQQWINTYNRYCIYCYRMLLSFILIIIVNKIQLNSCLQKCVYHVTHESRCTWAGLPLITGVWSTRLLHWALLRNACPEYGPVHVTFTWTIINEEQLVTMATIGMKGAEGHHHSLAFCHIQSTNVVLILPTRNYWIFQKN